MSHETETGFGKSELKETPKCVFLFPPALKQPLLLKPQISKLISAWKIVFLPLVSPLKLNFFCQYNEVV